MPLLVAALGLQHDAEVMGRALTIGSVGAVVDDEQVDGAGARRSLLGAPPNEELNDHHRKGLELPGGSRPGPLAVRMLSARRPRRTAMKKES